MAALQQKLGIGIYAAHFDHLTRNGKSTEEAYLVQRHCRNLHIPFFSGQAEKDAFLKGNFEKQYLTDFMVNLKDKPKKFKKLLNIIDNDIVKEKICLKISYSDYSNNKENIYELAREGYRFALILDDSVNLDEELLELLSIFSYVIITDSRLYEKLRNHYKVLYIPS